MGNYIWLLLIIIVFGILFYFFRDKIYIFLNQSEEQYPYKKKEFLLNTPERKFFIELQKRIPDDFVVFPQIVLSSIVSVNCSKNKLWKYQNKINRKTIDFVIFNKPYYKPVIAIEYDGKTHTYPVRIERDVLVNKILEQAGIKIFHVKHQENINFEDIKNKINAVLMDKNY
jgi:very-short-patch-repair endonuclease